MKCLVTGATGFIGAGLCTRLQAVGVGVLALSRHGSSPGSGIRGLALDLASSELPESWLDGVEVVCHLAGVAHQRATPQQYHAVNVEGSARVLEAALAAGVKRFIYCSSVKAMGPPPGPELRREGEETSAIDAYGASKRAAEDLLRARCADEDIDLVILRPALVYGAQARGNLSLLSSLARWTPLRLPQRGARSMISVDDLQRLLVDFIHNTPQGQNLWLVTDGLDYSASEIHQILRRAQGLGRAWLPLPWWLWRTACALRDLLGFAAPGERTLDKLFGTERYSSQALLKATSWRPRQSLPSVMRAGGSL